MRNGKKIEPNSNEWGRLNSRKRCKCLSCHFLSIVYLILAAKWSAHRDQPFELPPLLYIPILAYTNQLDMKMK